MDTAINEEVNLKPEGVTGLIEGLREAGIDYIASLPCSAFRETIPLIMDSPHFTHVPVANEADAVTICAGAWLGGKKPALLAENNGFVLGSHALMCLEYYFGGFPMLLILDHRGDFGDGDGYWYFAGSHMTLAIIDSLKMPYSIVRDSKNFSAEIIRGQKTTEAYGKPVVILLSGDEVW